MVEVVVMRFRCLPCEAAPEPPVTRPGHMAEPQTSRSHSWQPPKNVLPATSSKNEKPSNQKVQIRLLNNACLECDSPLYTSTDQSHPRH